MIKPEDLVPDYAKLALPVKKPGGHILIDNKHVADTMRCCHCGAQWIYIKGSKRLRGFCRHHQQVVCGRFECMPCIDAERRIEGVEKGESLNDVLQDLAKKPKLFIFGEGVS